MKSILTICVSGLFFASPAACYADEAFVQQATTEASTLNSLRMPMSVAVPTSLAALQSVGAGLVGSRSNVSLVSQKGNQNTAMVSQSGYGNLSLISQQGRGNVAVVTQTGRSH